MFESFIYFYLKYIWRGEIGKDPPFTGSLQKWPQHLELGQFKGRVFFHCFPRHICRMLDWKQNTQDLNRDPYGIPVPQVEA